MSLTFILKPEFLFCPLKSCAQSLLLKYEAGTVDCEFLNCMCLPSIVELPEAPGKPKVLSLTATTANLTWKEGDNGNVPIIKYRIQYKKSGKSILVIVAFV